jgi:uncharacterized glyoxalase superfamily protein PhnB
VFEAVHLILYVADQQRATAFYAATLSLEPTLNVPGMTEFTIGDRVVLGLMPSAGIKRLLGDRFPDPQLADGIPRAELYLVVSDPESYLARAADSGARILSPLAPRDWGHEAGYVLDPDGHVVAFARESRP